MHSVSVTNEQSPFFPELWKTYEASFPKSERRTLAGQRAIFTHPRYRLDAWVQGPESGKEKFVGLMGWWHYDGFRYLEHLAVSLDARSGGMGGKLLQKWMDASDKPVFLEIDILTDDISRRRLAFYQRLGFVENAIRHSQPDYHGGSTGVPLCLLSYPEPMTPAQYASLSEVLRRDVWPQAAA